MELALSLAKAKATSKAMGLFVESSELRKGELARETSACDTSQDSGIPLPRSLSTSSTSSTSMLMSSVMNAGVALPLDRSVSGSRQQLPLASESSSSGSASASDGEDGEDSGHLLEPPVRSKGRLPQPERPRASSLSRATTAAAATEAVGGAAADAAAAVEGEALQAPRRHSAAGVGSTSGSSAM